MARHVNRTFDQLTVVGLSKVVGGVTCQVIMENGAGDVAMCWGTAGGTSGFAKGCLMIRTDAGASTTVLSINGGNSGTAAWHNV